MGSPLTVEQLAGQKLMLAFVGKDRLPPDTLKAIREYQPAGFTLFRAHNVKRPAQVRELTQALQQAAKNEGLPPLLIAADQEGGQLMAVGEGTTPLPGNLALGATGSPELAHQAGEVLGRELSAMGINLNYAPCCDVNINPQNPVVGTRSFGEDPEEVANLSAAMVEGIQSCGVAATAKHFPGHGDTVSDSHHGIPVVPHALERLRAVEFPPFLSSILAGARAVMTAHLALPAIDRRADLPATLSPAILRGLLRQELGFTGVIVTDAMDMQAIRQGEALGREAVAAISAGADLLLLGSRPADQSSVYTSLVQALKKGTLDSGDAIASAGRVSALKGWLANQGPQPDLDVVGCVAHLAIAREIAERSITMVRDRAGILPLRPQAGQRLAVIRPQPVDLTPADTSSYVAIRLAEALRAFHPDVDEFAIPYAPQGRDISAILDRVRHHDFVIVGTLNAASQPGQAALVNGLLQMALHTIVVALRMPYDLMAFPEAPTYLCTYSILDPCMHALARALWGQIDIQGRLPVSIPGLYPCGYRDTPD